MDNFILEEVDDSIHENYYEKLDENSVILMVLLKKYREMIENDERLDIRYLYASKQYPVSSKNTKYIKENAKRLSLEEFHRLPKIKINTKYDITDHNVVLATNDVGVYAEAIQNDYGIGLITKFAPDIFCFDSTKLKIYEPFDDEVYIVMITRKGSNTEAMPLLEKLIKI